MPYSDADPPRVAKNWTPTEQHKCVMAANAVLGRGGSEEEAIYACIHAAGKSNQALESLASFAAGHELDMAIFAPGTWSGSAGPMDFSEEDMQKIVHAFDALREKHRVPLKLGHSGDRDLQEGQPALGWVERVWVQGGKLMAHAVSIPDVVWKALKDRLYRNVSIELDMGVKNAGKLYDLVLSGVALLGAEIPAVAGLPDLQAYMHLKGDRLVTFTLNVEQEKDPESEQKDGAMTNEEIVAKLEALTGQITEMTEKYSKATAQYAEAKTKIAEQDAELKELRQNENVRSVTEQKEAVLHKRREVNEELDRLVKAKDIQPGQREVFKKQFGVDDDDTVMKVDVQGIAKMFGAGIKTAKAKTAIRTGEREFAHGSGSARAREEGEGEEGESADVLLDRKAHEYIAKHNVPYSQALAAVQTQHPELVEAWFTGGNEVVSVGEKED